MPKIKKLSLSKDLMPGKRIKLTSRELNVLSRHCDEREIYVDRAIWCCAVRSDNDMENNIGCIGYIRLKKHTPTQLIWDNYLYGVEAVKLINSVNDSRKYGSRVKIAAFRFIKQIEENLDAGLRDKIIKLSGYSVEDLYAHLNEHCMETNRFLSFLILDKLYPGNSLEENKIRRKFLVTKSENKRLEMLIRQLNKNNSLNNDLKGGRK